MNEIKYIVSRELSINIAAQDADKLICRRDGMAALLYVFLLRSGGTFSLTDASEKLGVEPAEIRRAAEALKSMAMLEIDEIPLPEETLPEYTHTDMQKRTMQSEEFSVLVHESQGILGKVLSATELRILFGIYDYLGLPTEVILLLLSYCLARTQKRQGTGRIPSFRTIEREAYVWANREILTLDMAEAHLQYLQKLESETSKIKAVLGIHDRELVPTERKYIEAWVASGFPPESLALAYEKTVMKTGKLQWKYMNSILTSWHSKNLHSIEEIRGGDTMPITGGYNGKLPNNEPNMGNIKQLEKLRDKMKKD